MEHHISLVRAKIQDKYYTELKVRGFTVFSDEPESVGGTNRAPSPFDLMNISLASCTLMYLLNKASVEKIDVGTIKIKIKVAKNEGGNFKFKRVLYFENELSINHKEKLLNYANNSPVTRALRGCNEITTIIK